MFGDSHWLMYKVVKKRSVVRAADALELSFENADKRPIFIDFDCSAEFYNPC